MGGYTRAQIDSIKTHRDESILQEVNILEIQTKNKFKFKGSKKTYQEEMRSVPWLKRKKESPFFKYDSPLPS